MEMNINIQDKKVSQNLAHAVFASTFETPNMLTEVFKFHSLSAPDALTPNRTLRIQLQFTPLVGR